MSDAVTAFDSRRRTRIPAGKCSPSAVVTVQVVEILVVEDAPEFAQMVTAILRKSGHRVRIASTVTDAMAAMSSLPPELVVLDHTLPDDGGLDYRVIRDRSAYILVLSGRGEIDNRSTLVSRDIRATCADATCASADDKSCKFTGSGT